MLLTLLVTLVLVYAYLNIKSQLSSNRDRFGDCELRCRSKSYRYAIKHIGLVYIYVLALASHLIGYKLC